MRRILRWLSFGWNREARERELDDEIRFHLDEEAAEREAEGLPREQARLAALRDLGSVALVKESAREAWGWAAIGSFAHDVRYGMRTLAKNRAFALTAVASLALGIGANTAIYSIIDAAMVRTLPMKNPHELAGLQIKGGQSGPYFTNPLWEAIRDSKDAFAGVAAYSEDSFDISEGVERRPVRGLWVSGGYFDTLGVPALRGRVLTSADDRRGCGAAGPVAVISYDFWRRELQADPGAVGRVLRLERKAFTVVGVTPPWMKGLNRDQPYDVAIPIGCEPVLHAESSLGQGRWWLQIAGRMKPGAGLEETARRVNTFAPHIFRHAANPNPGLELLPCSTGFSWVRERYRTACLR